VLIALTHLGRRSGPGAGRADAGHRRHRGGDSHTFLYQAVEVKNADGVAVPIVQAGEFGVNLGRFDLRFVRSGGGWKLADYRYELLPVGPALAEAPDVAAVVAPFVAPLLRPVIGRLDADRIGKTPDERKQRTTQLLVDALVCRPGRIWRSTRATAACSRCSVGPR
jgi:2',3'-cyclic-nucleotide 2'-phosphodiesterase (5'-nucleotidase family)